MKLLKIIVCIAIFVSCSKKQDNEQTNSSKPLRKATYTLLDSIPLFNDSLAFSQVYPQKILVDSILVYQYPQLNLSLINKKGELLKAISKKGGLKGQFTGDFLFPFWCEDGNLYVLEEGNNCKITIFDKNLDFIKSISIAYEMGDKYVPVAESVMNVSIMSDQLVKVIITCGDVTRATFSKDYYKKGTGFVEMSIDRKNFNVKDIKYKLPYTGFDAVNKALDENKRYWHSPFGHLVKEDKKIFVKYNFDNKLYVYDENWEKLSNYNINPIYNGESANFNLTFDNYSEEKNPDKSILNQHSFEFSNINYSTFDVFDTKVFAIYKKPVKKDLLPKSTKDYINFSPIPVLHIFDLKTNEEHSIDLTTKFSPYREIFVENAQTVYIMGNPNLTEDVYLYKLHINYE